jgi:hypothetical protein
MKKGLILIAVINICMIATQAALWTREIPKVYPDAAYAQQAAAEDYLRNSDSNDPMYPLIKAALTRINKYLSVAGQKIGGPDCNKDGVVDGNDLAIVTKAMGADGRKWMILPKTSAKLLDINDANLNWQPAVYGDIK